MTWAGRVFLAPLGTLDLVASGWHRGQVAGRDKLTGQSVDDQDMDDAQWRDRRFTETPLAGSTLEERLASLQDDEKAQLLDAQDELPVAHSKPGKQRADGRGRGDRTSATEREQRTDRIEKLLRQGYPRHVIVAKFLTLNIAVRTTDRYIAEVRERWKLERLQRQDTVVEERLAHLSEVARMLRKREAWAPMMRAEEAISRMLGVDAPEKIDVRAAVLHAQVQQSAPEVDLSDLPDALLDALDAAAVRRGTSGGVGGQTPLLAAPVEPT